MRLVTRLFWLTALVMVLAFLSMGMGGFGGTQIVSKIPKPDRPFHVDVIDSEDVSYAVDEFSVDGLTFAPVMLGKAEMAVDFAKIRTLSFLLKDDKLEAVVEYINGNRKNVTVDPNLQFYGRTPWGNMRLAARDIREIRFK
ncbi:MAG: hypothetical protein SVS15_06815 [Thermodesulfobacteriota bacterium]|nr:hypothetical protein [Thermodesulfobacteriota bacterium]